MNNRDYKQSGVNSYYHIYNRGNSRDNIFLDDNDFSFFILRLNQNLFPESFKESYSRIGPLPSDSFSLLCYCLMPNHFHLVLRQNKDLPASKLMSRVCTSYSKYFNKKYQRIGHLFQDQFKQVRIDNNEYLTWLSAYVHQNPKVAGLIKYSADYKWSSYGDFIGRRNSRLIYCDTSIILDQYKNLQEYRRFVDESYAIIKANKELEVLLLD